VPEFQTDTIIVYYANGSQYKTYIQNDTMHSRVTADDLKAIHVNNITFPVTQTSKATRHSRRTFEWLNKRPFATPLACTILEDHF